MHVSRLIVIVQVPDGVLLPVMMINQNLLHGGFEEFQAMHDDGELITSTSHVRTQPDKTPTENIVLVDDINDGEGDTDILHTESICYLQTGPDKLGARDGQGISEYGNCNRSSAADPAESAEDAFAAALASGDEEAIAAAEQAMTDAILAEAMGDFDEEPVVINTPSSSEEEGSPPVTKAGLAGGDWWSAALASTASAAAAAEAAAANEDWESNSSAGNDKSEITGATAPTRDETDQSAMPTLNTALPGQQPGKVNTP